jgi:hypothetical protein
VLDYVNTGEMFWASGDKEREGKDILLMQNVLWLSDFFQLYNLQKICIDKHILPGLSSQNILIFIKDAYAKLLCSQEQDLCEQEDIWYDFFNKCIEISAENIDFLIREKDIEMMDLPEAVINEIIERALKLQQKVH